MRNITAMYKVIGNAVPVKLAEAIAKAVYQQVFSDAPNETLSNSHPERYEQLKMEF